MLKGKIRALRFGLIITFVYIIVTSIVISGIDIYFSIKNSKKDSEFVQKLYEQNIVDVLEGKIEGVVEYINAERSLNRERLLGHLKSQIKHIYYVFYELYLKELERGQSDAQIKKDLLDFAGAYYHKKKGECLIIFDDKGNMYFNKGKKDVVMALINKHILRSGLVYLKYKNRVKMLYISLFQPTGWYLAYCVDLTFEDIKIKSKVVEYLNKYRYGYKKHGYIFVSLLNNKSTNCKLKSILNPNRPDIVGKCLSLNKPDEKGKYYRKEMVRELLSKGYSVVTYYYKIPNTHEYGRKVSYVFLYKPWNWVIGTGFYLKDAGSEFYQEKLKGLWNTGEKVVIAVFTILALTTLIFFLFFSKIGPEIEYIIKFLEKFPEVKRINSDKFRFFETFFIAEKVNEMAKNVMQITENYEDMITRYYSITNYMKSCLVVVEKKDDDIYIKDVNSCVQKCMGIMRKSEVVGKTIHEFFRQFPSIAKRFEVIFERGISSDAVDIVKNVKNCGYRRYFQSEMFKITEHEAVYIADDITDSVMLYFRNSIERDRLASLIEDVDVGVAIINFEGGVIFFNSKLSNIFEIESFNIRKLKDLFINERTESDFEKHFREIINEKAECSSCVFEIETYRGNRRWIEITAVVDNINNEPVIVMSVKDITYKYLKEKEIEFISLHDDLTELYNRRFFKEELKRFFNKRSYPLSLVIFDINGLKMVNDLLGHSWGDWLIKKMASILKKSVRVVDIPARIGGDEFVLLMVNTDLDGVERCIKRINENLLTENKKDNQPYLSVSIGYAIQNGQFSTPDELFSEADRVMYEKKYSSKRNEELKRIWESIKKINPESIKQHKIEDFLKR